LSSADKIKVKEETRVYIEILIKKLGYSPSAAAWAIKYINEQLNKAEIAAALNINNMRKSI
jgi:DNA-binding LacI/PurR family transcriptional regulator